MHSGQCVTILSSCRHANFVTLVSFFCISPERLKFSSFRLKFHREIKGRFRKRVVLANVPSFRFSFRGNIRRNHPFGNHPFVNTKKGHWEIKGRFPKGWFWRAYPRSSFRSGEHPPKPPFWKPPFCEPPKIFNLACRLQSRLKCSILTLRITHTFVK